MANNSLERCLRLDGVQQQHVRVEVIADPSERNCRVRWSGSNGKRSHGKILPHGSDIEAMPVALPKVLTMNNYEDNSDYFQKLYAEMQEEEDVKRREEELKRRCPSSGGKVGIMIERPGSDDWYIQCPACGMQWAGGSIVLSEHNKPGC